MKRLRRLRNFWLWPGSAIVPAFTAIGLSLIFQSERFSRTPAYANLLGLISAPVWGMAYLLVAVLFFVYQTLLPVRWVAVVAHTVGFILIGWWWLAFVIRYFTDSSTTVVNVVSWSVFLFLLIRSVWMIDVAILSTRSTMGNRTVSDPLA